jgi:hypothetical protein
MKHLISRVNAPYLCTKINSSAVHTLRLAQQIRFAATAALEGAQKPPPAGGELPGIATSKVLRQTRDSALKTPGLVWTEEETSSSPDGGRETRKMNMYQAVSNCSSVIDVVPFAEM